MWHERRIPVIDPDFDDVDAWLVEAVREIGRTGAVQTEKLFRDVDFHEGANALTSSKIWLGANAEAVPAARTSVRPAPPVPVKPKPPVLWVQVASDRWERAFAVVSR